MTIDHDNDHHPGCGCCPSQEGNAAPSGNDAAAERRRAPSGAARTAFRVRDLDCASCARGLERRLRSEPGVVRAEINAVTGFLELEHFTSVREVAATIAAAGYRAEPVAGSRPRPEPVLTEPHARAFLAAAVPLAAGWSAHVSGAPGFIAPGLYVLAALAGGTLPLRRVVQGLRRGALQVDMNLLLVLAVIGALAIGEYAEGGMVVTLYALGHVLEARTVKRSRGSLSALLALAPDEAVVRRDGREETVAADSLVEGDRVVVRPGARIPVDGRVVGGSSEVNQSPVTGEPMPVLREAGDEVFAGSLNGHGYLEIETTRAAGETTLDRIRTLVEEAQARRAPVQRTVDRFAAVYTPAVVAAALLIAVLPPLAGQPFLPWFYRGLAVLVLACPCSLVLSTPVAIAAGISTGAGRGILFKGGAWLEGMGRLRQAALDKTGTLTVGRPTVAALLPADGVTGRELLIVAAAVEQASEHHLARAVVREAERRGLDIPPVTDFEAVPGAGVRGRVDGAVCGVGGGRLGPPLEGIQEPEEWRHRRRRGYTLVLVHRGDRVMGALAIGDAPRPNAAAAVAGLRSLGVRRIIMLTGDNPAAAEAVARQAGITEWRAGLLPQDKARIVDDLQREGPLAMVGDGINDAPALAAADVGVAMGLSATDLAAETAGVTLVNDDLSRLPAAVRLGRRALGLIRQNIAIVLALKLTALALVVAGWFTLWLAIAADTGAAVIVLLNSMRLLRHRR